MKFFRHVKKTARQQEKCHETLALIAQLAQRLIFEKISNHVTAI